MPAALLYFLALLIVAVAMTTVALAARRQAFGPSSALQPESESGGFDVTHASGVRAFIPPETGGRRAVEAAPDPDERRSSSRPQP